MRLNLNLSQKGLVLVLMPLLLELVFFAGVGVLLHETEKQAMTAAHFKAVNSDASVMITRLYQLGTTVIAYSLAKSDALSNRYNFLLGELRASFKSLREEVGSDAEQQKLLDAIEPDLQKAINFFQQMKTTMDGGRELVWLATANRWVDPNGPLPNLMVDIHKMVDYQTRAMGTSPQAESDMRALVAKLLAVGVLFNIALAVVVAFFVTRGITRRVESLTDNALRLAAGRPLSPPTGGDDEIARLDRVFHDMARTVTVANQRERAIVEHAADVIFALDENGKFIKVSPASSRVWGYAPDDLLGCRYPIVVHDDDVGITAHAIKDIMAGTSTVSFENRVQRKDGTVLETRWSAHWVASQRAMFCVAHDITERKVAEDLLRANEARVNSILNNMLIGLVMIDAGGTIESVNSRTENLFDYKLSELTGKKYGLLFTEDGAAGPKFNKETGGNGSSSAPQMPALGKLTEMAALKRDGTTFPVEVTFSEYEAADEKRFILNILDITQRHEVERLKKEFLSMVSHDLRSPLSSVLTSLSLLSVGAMGPINDSGQELLRNSENELNWLMQLTKDLLDIARMEAGKLDLRIARTRMSEICDRAAMAVQGPADQRRVTVEQPTNEIKLRADGDRLTQVLVHFLSEAIKGSEEGSTVKISVRADASEIEVRVSGDGLTIPLTYKKAMDEEFILAEAISTREKSNTGLELAICKKIIEGHKGTLGVDSEPGTGDAFWFRIEYVPV